MVAPGTVALQFQQMLKTISPQSHVFGQQQSYSCMCWFCMNDGAFTAILRILF